MTSLRTARTALALALAATALAGCTPQPAPTPSPTAGFATEDEAFAAAEETYRAYVDALNAVDLSDPETFEDVYAWTTGDANSEFRRTFSEMHANGWTVSGLSEVQIVEGTEWSPSDGQSSLAICIDVSAVELVDSSGSSVVDADRPDVQSMRVDLQETPGSATGWLISSLSGREGEPTCR